MPDEDQLRSIVQEELAKAAQEQNNLGAAQRESSNVRCPSCGKPAQRIPERRLPKIGAIVIEGYTAHPHDGDVYYHPDEVLEAEEDEEDEDEEEDDASDDVGPAEELTDDMDAAAAAYGVPY